MRVMKVLRSMSMVCHHLPLKTNVHSILNVSLISCTLSLMVFTELRVFLDPHSICVYGEMAIAGAVREFYPSGLWWAGTPHEQWPRDPETIAFIQENWDPRFGDRMQQLIFIGKPEILEPIRTALEACLLSDEDIALGPDVAANCQILLKTGRCS